MPDVALKLLADFRQQRVDCSNRPLRDELDRAVRQVLDVTRYRMPAGQGTDGVPEADPLDMPFKNNDPLNYWFFKIRLSSVRSKTRRFFSSDSAA